MIWQMIEDWFRGILTDGILSNLSGLFDSINTEVGEVAGELGATPAAWNAGIFNMIRSFNLITQNKATIQKFDSEANKGASSLLYFKHIL